MARANTIARGAIRRATSGCLFKGGRLINDRADLGGARRGKTTTEINLAITLADAGSRVALVDADLRRPSVAEYTGLEGQVGLTTVLIGQADAKGKEKRKHAAASEPAQQPPALGLGPAQLRLLAACGKLERTGRGVYRVMALPVDDLPPYAEAVAWAHGPAAISHESALVMRGIGDFNPHPGWT